MLLAAKDGLEDMTETGLNNLNFDGETPDFISCSAPTHWQRVGGSAMGTKWLRHVPGILQKSP